MSGKQEIGISEMSEFFGITPEAIRKYEGKGIVQVRRDENNKYRKYTTWEVMAMIHARRHSQMGFTLGQAAEILKTSDGHSYIQNVEKLQMKLAKEVAWKRKLILALEQKKKARCSIEFQGDRIQIEQFDETLYFGIIEDLCLCSEIDQESREKWLEMLPLVSDYVICGQKDYLPYSTGFAISRRNAELFGLSDLKAAKILPESICATCILKGDYDELITDRKIGETAVRIEEMGHKIVGEVIAEIFDFAKVEGKYEVLHKCYFPIEI